METLENAVGFVVENLDIIAEERDRALRGVYK
jgi:hypothetical protein